VRSPVVAAQSAPGAVILPLPTPLPPAGATPSPSPTTLCALDDPFAISDTAGFATITLRSGTQPGPVTVAACADTVVSGVPSPLTAQEALVTVTSGPVNRVGVTINSKSIDNNDGTLLTTASAVVTDAQGNTVEDGVPVFFEILCAGGACRPGDPSLNIAISSNSTTNGIAPCDVSQFIIQTGIPISPQPGDAITCIKYPISQQGSEVLVRASVAGVASTVAGTALTLPGRIANLAAIPI